MRGLQTGTRTGEPFGSRAPPAVAGPETNTPSRVLGRGIAPKHRAMGAGAPRVGLQNPVADLAATAPCSTYGPSGVKPRVKGALAGLR